MIGLGASLLEMREGLNLLHDQVPDNASLHPIAFASKPLSSVQQWHSKIEREALGILCGLKEFHHYCFAKEVHGITDQIPLVAMMKKDVVTLSWWLQ